MPLASSAPTSPAGMARPGIPWAAGESIIYNLAMGPDGSLYAGGLFTTAGGVDANGIARWDGSAWYALGSGAEGYYGSGLVYELEAGSGGSLFAGGDFTVAGGIPANYIARWDSATRRGTP